MHWVVIKLVKKLQPLNRTRRMARVSNSAVWNILSNFLILILCSLPGIIFEFVVNNPSTPFQRGFYCNDESIRYPIKKSTISNAVAVALYLGVPFVCMLIVEWLLFRRYKVLGELSRDVPMYRGTKVLCLKLHSYIVAVFSAYIPFLFAATVTLSLTNTLKYMLGRLRPHFLAVCQPDFTALQSRCSGPEGYHAYVQDIPCDAQADQSDLLDARLSFPSGHASGAACCFIYLALYFQFRMVWKGPALLRPFLQAVFVVGAMMITATRVSDYMHFWSDVFFGFFLGTVIGVLVAFFVSDLYFFETPSVITNSVSTKEFITTPSDTDLSTIVTISNYQSTDSEFNQTRGTKPSNI